MTFLSFPIRADIVFDRPTVDLGRVQGGTVEHQFAFRVVGDAPATIVDARGSCGCLRTEVERRTYRPGETGTLPLRIHALSQAASHKRFELRLLVRDPRERTIVLTAEAEIVSDWKVTPANLIVQLHEKQTMTQTISVLDNHKTPRTIVGVSASSPLIHPRLSHRDGSGRHCLLELRLEAPRKACRLEERVELKLGDGTALEVPITLVRPASLTAVPDSLRLRTADLADGTIYRTVNIVDRTGKAGITNVVCDDAVVGCSWRAESPNLYRVRLAIPPGAKSSMVRVRFSNHDELTVPLVVEP